MNKFMETLKKLLGTVKDKWTALSKKIRIIIIAAASVVIVSLVVLIIILNRTDMAVLCSGLSATETSEIVTVLQSELGATDVRVNSLGEILVPDTQVDNLRMQLSIKGYPKTSFNNDVYDTGVSMFSTETEIRTKQIQQLSSWLMATFNTIGQVESSYVILNVPDSPNYVIATDEEVSSASVVLHLKEGATLTNEQIDGIYNITVNAVPNLTREHVTLADGTGRQLLVEIVDETEENADDSDVVLYNKGLEYAAQIQGILVDNLDALFKQLYKHYNITVSVQLDYEKRVTETTEYTPSVEEAGTSGGMISDITASAAGGKLTDVEGIVGTTTNADISPDYPTLEELGDGESYYEAQKTINYKVNEEKNQIEKSGYITKLITASVVVDDTNMSEAEKAEWKELIANAVGSDVAKVSIKAQPFLLDNPTESSEGTIVTANNNRNILIFVLCALGALLLILLLLAIMTSSSRKKRHIKARMAAQLAAAANGSGGSAAVNTTYDDDGNVVTGSGGTSGSRSSDGNRINPDEFEIPSLLETTSDEAKEAILKREIREFTKSNPEIVAQLIRTWMKNDNG